MMRPRVLALALIAGVVGLTALASAQTRRQPRHSPAFDFDRRAGMRLSARPNDDQVEAVARLRDALSGSLLDAYDPASGVTHSLLNPVGKLTGPSSAEPLDIALAFARDNVTLLGLESDDLDEMAIL